MYELFIVNIDEDFFKGGFVIFFLGKLNLFNLYNKVI